MKKIAALMFLVSCGSQPAPIRATQILEALTCHWHTEQKVCFCIASIDYTSYRGYGYMTWAPPRMCGKQDVFRGKKI